MIPDYAETLARAKHEIIMDVLGGIVPHDVKGFAELHDFTDANKFGGAFDLFSVGSDGTDEFMERECAFWNRVQDAIDAWIKSGDMVKEAAEEETRMEAGK